MGADIIGWRFCPLQRQLEPTGFLSKLKLRAYKAVIEQRVPEAQRGPIKLTVVVNGEQRQLTYAGIVEDLQSFEAGIPECADCEVGGGTPLGCYRYVTFPVDEAFERVVFDFFVSQVATADSICDQLHRDVVSRVPPSGTAWHLRRGGPQSGGLASLPQPLTHTWGGLLSKKRVDSAQILHACWRTLDQPAAIVAYARFWTELVGFARTRGVTPQSSRTMAEILGALPLYVSIAALSLQGRGAILVDA